MLANSKIKMPQKWMMSVTKLTPLLNGGLYVSLESLCSDRRLSIISRVIHGTRYMVHYHLVAWSVRCTPYIVEAGKGKRATVGNTVESGRICIGTWLSDDLCSVPHVHCPRAEVSTVLVLFY